MITGAFVNFPAADLQSIKTACLACLLDNFVAHQSYSIAGRSINRANVGQVSSILAEVNYAIAFQAGTIIRTSVPDFSNPCP